MSRNNRSSSKSFTRKKQTCIKILNVDYMPPSPQTQKWIRDALPNKHINFTPIKSLEKMRSGRKKALNQRKDVYIQDLSTSRFSMFYQQTPQADYHSPYRVHVGPQYNISHTKSIKIKLNFNDDVVCEKFSFDLTPKDLLNRGKRPVPQKKVMENLTSKTYLEAFGAKLLQETQHQVEFHWAHRRAWSLNGDQSKENLDATTAGSNYDTLFKVENPMKMLLRENITTLIHVEGTVKFINNKQRIAESITYHFTWNQGKSCTVIIDPLSLRFPTQDEADVAEMIVRMESRLS